MPRPSAVSRLSTGKPGVSRQQSPPSPVAAVQIPSRAERSRERIAGRNRATVCHVAAVQAGWPARTTLPHQGYPTYSPPTDPCRSQRDDTNLPRGHLAQCWQSSRRRGWRETQACQKWSKTDLNSFTNRSTSRCILPDNHVGCRFKTHYVHKCTCGGAQSLAVHRPPQRFAVAASNGVRLPIPQQQINGRGRHGPDD